MPRFYCLRCSMHPSHEMFHQRAAAQHGPYAVFVILQTSCHPVFEGDPC
jgi:hypothetical protein